VEQVFAGGKVRAVSRKLVYCETGEEADMELDLKKL
jgi:hypothetical protein